MRKDQPKLRKQFKEYEKAIALFKRKLEHRENVIGYLNGILKSTQLEHLIARIEYERLLKDKPALTIPYAFRRDVTNYYKNNH